MQTELRELRLMMHLTQEGMASMLGCSKSTIKNWEAGRHSISPLAQRSVKHLLKSCKKPRGRQ